MEEKPEKTVTSIDYEALAQTSEDLRELFRAFVAGLIADGFTDEQARILITGVLRSYYKDDPEGGTA